ncbi:tautomerase family protein [Sphingobacterium sp. JB170]|uniref:tautomerase family protein n=1 Tax=Sphingobacterium sp. JB170 TaxID=1434842 RepID=UPI00097EF090|nr:tautomerase family protein [Sphingobacterium sp. JB170]SJN36472.1 probable tautomerase [Sphingobacterium sp. JB170]
MPLVRITLSESYELETQTYISQAIHNALVQEFNIPKDDYFHIIEKLPPIQLRFPKEYLNIKHTAAIIFIQIIAAVGRTITQKERLYKRISDNIEYSAKINPQDIIISLIENEKENWSFGHGEMQTFNHI